MGDRNMTFLIANLKKWLAPRMKKRWMDFTVKAVAAAISPEATFSTTTEQSGGCQSAASSGGLPLDRFLESEGC
jgi:hypothetical protein